MLPFVFACGNNDEDDDFSFDGTKWEYSFLKEMEDVNGNYTFLENRYIVFQKDTASIITIKSYSFPEGIHLIPDDYKTSFEESIYKYVYNYPVVKLFFYDKELNLTMNKDMKSLTLEENEEKIVFERTE